MQEAYSFTADELAELGFLDELRGVHTSRTMMFSELEVVLGYLQKCAGPDAVRNAIVSENVLGKATRSGRIATAQKLTSLYLFEPNKPLYSTFEILWTEASTSRPVLALLLAQCRDAVLRISSPAIIASRPGDIFDKASLYELLKNSFASKYAETTLLSTAQNLASSWRQSRHIVGLNKVIRARAPADYRALSFAIFIGYLRGFRGQMLMASDWIRLLDMEPAELETNLELAHRYGFVTQRKIGEVLEIRPGPILWKGDSN